MQVVGNTRAETISALPLVIASIKTRRHTHPTSVCGSPVVPGALPGAGDARATGGDLPGAGSCWAEAPRLGMKALFGALEKCVGIQGAGRRGFAELGLQGRNRPAQERTAHVV